MNDGLGEARAVILVEGPSDRAAVLTLAERLGRDLPTEGVSVVSMGGASAIGAYLSAFSDRGISSAGLCDVAQEYQFRFALERAGLGSDLSRSAMEELGFYVCVVDLEDELIRALGTAAVEAILDREGELRAFRTFQNQPAWRDGALHDQLHRFLGIRSGRKARYGRLLVEALDLDRVPAPLLGVLGRVGRPEGQGGTPPVM